MSKQILAIALCRVSSFEQLDNNSLNRQREAVLKAAGELGAVIPENYWWAGNVSSKRGTNLKRKDLQEALSCCKKDKRIKYVIVDEPDRFMRSINEAAYFEVTFDMLGVKVWYASDPELNKGDLSSKLLKFTKYLSAEGSNEERQHKSLAGLTKALNEGRYPFPPKPGYRKGYELAIHEVDSVRGPILRNILIKIATKRLTPSQALAELNASDFMKGHSLYKMDKFRAIVIDPFYAGIVEVNKQIKLRNEDGLHKPLITRVQHYELVKIMSGKTKNQSGPRKNGNPEYPLSNLITCEACRYATNGKLVGFKHGNGKVNSTLVYHKYRCRACGAYQRRDDLHAQIEKIFKPIIKESLDDLMEALDIVWERNEAEAERETERLSRKIKVLNEGISNQVEAATDPKNASIRAEILSLIEKKKTEIADLETSLEKLAGTKDNDRERFLRFAFSFIDHMGSRFLDTKVVSRDNRLRCKQILFPAGFYVDRNKKVYTPEISELYRLATTKKDTGVSNISHLVRLTHFHSNTF